MGCAGIEAVGQIAIAVTDVNKSLAFYRDVLGLQFLFQPSPELAFLDCGGVRLMLTTLQGEERDHKTSAIYYRVADIAAATEHIKAQGIEFVREPQMVAKMPDHDLWMGFVRDPDETLVGIMAEVRE